MSPLEGVDSNTAASAIVPRGFNYRPSTIGFNIAFISHAIVIFAEVVATSTLKASEMLISLVPSLIAVIGLAPAFIS